MTTRQLLEALGYTDSNANWITEGEQAPLIRRAVVTAEQNYADGQQSAQGYLGSYTFRTPAGETSDSPRQAAIHVIEASSLSAARDIHRRLWCTGSAPFLLIILPGEVRVYSGFKYDVNTKKDKPLQKSALTLEAVRTALADFEARRIDEGRIWGSRGHQLFVQQRVDYRLLENLTKLTGYLRVKTTVTLTTAQAIIGKYIYFHYLRARSILTPAWMTQNGVQSEEVFGSSPTLSAFRRLTVALQERFNGQIFPLPLEGPDAPTEEAVRYVAATMNGDEVYTGQLALDFGAYDFSYIPVELLSSIYEKFMNEAGQGRREGAVYTPEPLAEYLLTEINEVLPLTTGMRILDPCCGSGVFLVLAYRRLIRQHRRSAGRALTPDELKEILTASIYGVERNREACYVTEFSLLLTMLSEIDPPELERNEGFRFPDLHNENIFAEDFFGKDSAFLQHEATFDWVIGNPPWAELKPQDPGNAPILSWMNRTKKEMPTSRYRTSEAFCWRAPQMLRPGGHTAFLIHATSLVNESGAAFRSGFFTEHTILRITNFANLAYILFANADVPAAALVYRHTETEEGKPPIIHFGPFVANQLPVSPTMPKRLAWVITVYDNEIQIVDPDEAEKGNAATWKFALWGNHLDRGAVRRLRRLFRTTLGELFPVGRRKSGSDSRNGWEMRLGVQLRDDEATEETEEIPSLRGLRHLDTTGFERQQNVFRLALPDNTLTPIPENQCRIRKGRRKGLETINAPHLFLNHNVAAFSEQDFVFAHPQIGLKVPPEDEDHLRALAIILNSSLFRYLMFFLTPSWGISVSQLAIKMARQIPVPVLSPEQIGALAALHRILSREEVGRRGLFSEDIATAAEDSAAFFARQQETIDATVRDALNVPPSLFELATEFINVRYRFVKGKQDGAAMTPPDKEQLSLYAARLRDSLDEYAGARHALTVLDISRDAGCISVVVEVTDQPASDSFPIEPQILGATGVYRPSWENLLGRRNQWFYVQRNLKVFAGDSIHLLKPARRLDWTRTQALLDASDLIADIVNYSWKGEGVE